MPTQNAYDEVERLVRKFKNLSAAARKAYNEDNTRKDFILPLFRALEWDTQDSAQVSAEEKVSRGWVDFSFRISGVPRFFLETKRMSEDLTKPQWVRQAMDYAWTKGVTWALLSDFEGLRVFNAEWKEDNPLRAQFIDFGVDTYLADFERLWWLSRPQTVAGTLDREAEKVGKKARREPVSQHLFDDLKAWRQFLYKNVRASNPLWSPAQLDAAVLRLLNRLIFLRAAEDRQVEPPLLRPLLRELRDQKRVRDLWPELAKLFRQADATYDSQLFEHGLVDTLKWDSSPLEVLIEGLYGKQFLLYNFNAIDADVLGTAYEQYLGHIVASEASPAAEVVEKRAKRKSQGIFYTPTFVVKYIVGQTLGRYLDEHGYNPGRPVRILDMACGSGSFLIEAFDVLDRHVAEMRGDLTPHPPLLAGEGAQGERLDFHDHARQMELLTGCIYGVDKDEQAVAVARLNLLLKALHTRDRLPMLANIRCGDSLISGTTDELRAAFGPNWQDKRPFNWRKEFPEVFPPLPGLGEGEGGEGFDVIVGNPPYVRQETLGEAFKAFVAGRYATHAGTADLYVYFIEQAMQLLKPGGYFGFIVANKWLRANYGGPLRRWLKGQHIVEIVDFGDLPVFQSATTYPCILILRKDAPAATLRVTQVKSLDFANLADVVEAQSYQVTQAELDDAGWSLSPNATQAILNKMRTRGVPLGEYVDGRLFYGIKTGLNEAFVITSAIRDRLISEDARSEEIIKPFLVGRDVKRYAPLGVGRYVIFTKRGVDIDRYPAIKNYLLPFRQRLMPKPPDWKGPDWEGRKPGPYEWYEIQDTVDYFAEFEKPKIMWPGISAEVSAFAFDPLGIYGNDNTQVIGVADHYLLGTLNSKLSRLFLMGIADAVRGGYYRLKMSYVSQIPIRRINFSDLTDVARHDRIVALVDEMLALQREHAAAARVYDDAREGLARRIAAVDAAIDREVYALYGLTEAEIALVAGGLSTNAHASASETP